MLIIKDNLRRAFVETKHEVGVRTVASTTISGHANQLWLALPDSKRA